MIDCDSLEYAHARLLARHGQRAAEHDWERLENAREWPALLDAARDSVLRPWLVGITAQSGSRQIEAVLRARTWRVFSKATVTYVGQDYRASSARSQFRRP